MYQRKMFSVGLVDELFQTASNQVETVITSCDCSSHKDFSQELIKVFQPKTVAKVFY